METLLTIHIIIYVVANNYWPRYYDSWLRVTSIEPKIGMYYN